MRKRNQSENNDIPEEPAEKLKFAPINLYLIIFDVYRTPNNRSAVLLSRVSVCYT